jgi:hypothetical protein
MVGLMNIQFKQNSFIDIYNKPSTDNIDKNIEKGYLSRREVTVLLDNINKKPVAVESDGNGGFKWKVGDQEINLNDRTTTTPFWLRRISHWFKMTFSSKYENIFKDKVSKVHEALDKLKLEKLNIEISKLEIAIESWDNLNLDKKAWEAKYISAVESKEELTDHHANLENLHQKLENNTFGGLVLDDSDKKGMETLEKFLYSGNDFVGLRLAGNREEQLKILVGKIKAQNELKNLAETELQTLSDWLEKNKPAYNQNLQELDKLKKEADALKAKFPLPEVADDNAEISGVRALLEGTNDIDQGRMREAQDFENNPLRNKKALFTSIANKDGLYENTIVPGLIILCKLLAPNEQASTSMFNKWKAGLEECAQKWKEAGSEEQGIDNLIPLDFLFDNVMKINGALSFLAKTKLNVGQFFTHLNALNIPKNMDFVFAVTDAQAEKILSDYLENPDGTDLSQLFDPNTVLHTWPKDCQFFLGISLLKIRLDNSKAATHVNFRQNALNGIHEAEAKEEPQLMGTIFGLASASEFFFNIGIAKASSYIPDMNEEGVRLAETKSGIINLSPEDEQKFQAAFDFAKTPARIAFDQAYVKFVSRISHEAMDAIAAKHAQKTELDLYKIVLNLGSMRDKRKDLLQSEKNYIKSLENASQATKNSNKKDLEKLQGQQLINTLNLLQTISAFTVKNTTFVNITKALDESVMTAIVNEPLNLETTPFIPWLQKIVLNPIIAVV